MDGLVVSLLYPHSIEDVMELYVTENGGAEPALFPSNPPPALAHRIKQVLGLQRTPQVIPAAGGGGAPGDTAAYVVMGSTDDSRCATMCGAAVLWGRCGLPPTASSAHPWSRVRACARAGWRRLPGRPRSSGFGLVYARSARASRR